MSKQEIIKIFGDRKIRSVWDDEAEIWYFSIVGVDRKQGSACLLAEVKTTPQSRGK